MRISVILKISHICKVQKCFSGLKLSFDTSTKQFQFKLSCAVLRNLSTSAFQEHGLVRPWHCRFWWATNGSHSLPCCSPLPTRSLLCWPRRAAQQRSLISACHVSSNLQAIGFKIHNLRNYIIALRKKRHYKETCTGILGARSRLKAPHTSLRLTKLTSTFLRCTR